MVRSVDVGTVAFSWWQNHPLRPWFDVKVDSDDFDRRVIVRLTSIDGRFVEVEHSTAHLRPWDTWPPLGGLLSALFGPRA